MDSSGPMTFTNATEPVVFGSETSVKRPNNSLDSENSKPSDSTQKEPSAASSSYVEDFYLSSKKSSNRRNLFYPSKIKTAKK